MQKDVEGKVHKRVDSGASAPEKATETEDVTDKESDTKVAGALEKPNDPIVKRVSYGLMRLDSQRRFRVLLRRFAYLLVIAIVVYVLWHFFGDRVPVDDLSEWWQEMSAKLFPDYSHLEAPKPEVLPTEQLFPTEPLVPTEPVLPTESSDLP